MVDFIDQYRWYIKINEITQINNKIVSQHITDIKNNYRLFIS